MTFGKSYDEDDWEDGDVVGPDTLNPHATDHATLEDKTSGISSDGTQADFDEVYADTDTVTVDVPGDFDTLDEALNEFGLLSPPGHNVEVNIESGHEIETPVHLHRGFWGHVDITADDSTVNVGSGFPSNQDVFRINNGAVGPFIIPLIDANGRGENAVNVRTCSSVNVSNGIINAGRTGLLVSNAATAEAYGTDWSGADNVGVRVDRVSRATLGGPDGTPGVGPDVSNAGSHGIEVGKASIVRATSIRAHDCGGHAAFVKNTSSADLRWLQVEDAGGSALYASQSANVNINNCDISGDFGNDVVQLHTGSRANMSNGSISDHNRNDSIRVDTGALLIARNASITGGSVLDIRAVVGGRAILWSTETSSSSDGDPHQDDIRPLGINEIHGDGYVMAEGYES